MIIKSRGIVLSYIKYGDTSIIVRVFTETKGYGSYIVNGIRSQRAKRSIGYFQPFSVLDLVMYTKDTREIQRISEFKSCFPLHRIHQDPVKSAITLFLTEVLSKLLQAEQEPNPRLFQFIQESIQVLNDLKEGVANFHLQFLLKLGPFLGFAIDDMDDLFRSTDRISPSTEIYECMEALMHGNYGMPVKLSRDQRNEVLGEILIYYEHHGHLPKPKSFEILRSILS